jgi:hypothetical protein
MITSACRSRPVAAYSSANSQYSPVSPGAHNSSCCTTGTASAGSLARSASASRPGSYTPASFTQLTGNSGNTPSVSAAYRLAARSRLMTSHFE